MTENVLQEKEFPKTHVSNIKKHLVFRLNCGWAFAFSFLILSLRNDLAEVFYPLLYNEDGRIIFATFYNDHSFQNIFLPYNGYIQCFPNFLGYLLQFFPVTWIPSLYGLVSLSFTALTYALIFPLVDRVFNHKGFALYAVLFLISMPLADFRIVGTLMFQIWHCSMALFLLAFSPIPCKPLKKVLYLLFINILIWSHPYTILVLPIYLYKMVRSESRWENGLLAVSLVIYFSFGIEHHSMHFNSLSYFAYSLLNRVATDSLLGPFNRLWIQYMGISMVFGFTVAAFIASMIWISWKKMKTEELMWFVVLAYVVLTTLGVALLARDLGDNYHILNKSPRYTYLPRVAFLMMVLAAFFLLFKKSLIFRKSHWILAGLVLFINTNGMVFFKTDLKMGQSVRDYMAYLDQNQLDCRTGEKHIFYLRRGGWQQPGIEPDWSIPANLCRH